MVEDYLTGLMSAGDFIIETSNLVKENTRNLVFITNDISNFKYINELYGIAEGDKFIGEMAHFFFIDNPNCLAACRTGCDQFRGVFDMGNKTKEEEIDHVIQMNSEFEKKMSAKYPNVFLHVYTGLYFMSDDTNIDARAAMDRAHHAKKLIKGKFNIKCQVYDPDQFNFMMSQMETSNLFIHACENDGILLYLQPKFSVSKDTIIGAEALVRLRNDKGEIVSPGLFIPVLEETGMIGKLDEIMIEKVFQTQRKWLDEGKELFPISVNVSRMEFSKEGFAQMVIKLQQKYQIPPKYVEFEILESTFIEALNYITTAINDLREYGFPISVDDFGSGYSSLNQISNIPADIIKLDRVFASKGLAHEKGRTVLKALIQLLREIDYEIVFEGIETEEQRDLACSYGCDIIQGFLYSKPIPVTEFEAKYF